MAKSRQQYDTTYYLFTTKMFLYTPKSFEMDKLIKHNVHTE